MKIIPYLNFAGNCREVLDTYQRIFNGKIHDLNHFSDGNFPVPDDYKDKIMHARLTFGDNLLMFSDTMPGAPVDRGNGIQLSIALNDEALARSVFDQLAEGGEVMMPMEKQFWGAIFGQLKDRFGVLWMVNCTV